MAYQAASNRWIYVALVLGIVVLGNSFAMFLVVLQPSNNMKTLTEQIANLETQIKALNTQRRDLVYLNQSGNELVTRIYDLTRVSVVRIENRQRTAQGLVPYSLGSGFVYRVDDQAQYIVTNNHVVEGASSLLVSFESGNSSEATTVGTDPYSDLAVIRLNTNMPWLSAVPLGNSSILEVGERVLAIGSPFGLSGTMTSGIVSQLQRDIDATGNYKIVDIIQIDAAINPGNSGGPLMNLLGEVVGMNTAILTDSGTSSGVGFAIPSDTISREVPDLISTGSYSHPYLGVSGTDVTYDIAQAANLNVTYGFLVGSVAFNSPMAQAGIQGGTRSVPVLGQTVTVGGDLVVAIDGHRVTQLDDISVYLERNERPGDKVTFTVIRGNQKIFPAVTLGTRPNA